MKSAYMLILSAAVCAAFVSCQTEEPELATHRVERHDQVATQGVFRLSNGTTYSVQGDNLMVSPGVLRAASSEHVNLSLRNVHARTLLIMYHEFSGKKVLVDEDVDAVLTINADRVPRDQALETMEKALLKAGVVLIKVDDNTVRASRVKKN